MERQLRALGFRIRKLRSEKGYSQEAFADACKINRGHMGVVERGKANVQFDTLWKVAKALDVSIASLLKGIA
jgi:transcriptional regulator with XRE-family HTH domain